MQLHTPSKRCLCPASPFLLKEGKELSLAFTLNPLGVRGQIPPSSPQTISAVPHLSCSLPNFQNKPPSKTLTGFFSFYFLPLLNQKITGDACAPCCWVLLDLGCCLVWFCFLFWHFCCSQRQVNSDRVHVTIFSGHLLHMHHLEEVTDSTKEVQT